MDIRERAKGEDIGGARQTGHVHDAGGHRTIWGVARYASEEDRKAGRRYSLKEALRLFGAPQFTAVKGNLLLNEGINQLWTILCSSGGTKYDNANAQLGVGTGTGAAQATDSALTNGVWKGMMTSFPTYGTSQQAVWKSEFLSAEANQAWEEFSVRNGASADLMLNRKVESQGTKSSGQVWELTLTITLS